MATKMATIAGYGTGTIYRTAEGRFRGSYDAGFLPSGARRRVTASGKSEAIVKKRLRDKIKALEAGEEVAGRVTVKAWADEYLEMRVTDLAPKAYNAAANPIKNWVIPIIGHKRLDQLTPADIRSVDAAQRRKGRQPNDTRRVLMTMLRSAVEEGHTVPARVFATKKLNKPVSDRASMSVDQGLACLQVAEGMPRGVRWMFTLLYGVRMGEALGLTRDAINFGAGEFGEAVIEWQLQPLPYRIPRDRSSGFRVPDGYEARHLVDAYHLIRPKTQSGYRVAPFLEPVRTGMIHALEAAAENPWGLIWPEENGRPMNDKHDRAEWKALQDRAGVAHPEGRPFHVHECRNFAATMLLEANVDEHVIKSLLGHSSIVTSRKYMTVRREPLMDGLRRVGERLAIS
jgi:site-specific recombinase XerD